MKRNRPGFTLIELLVVITIIGILAAMLFPVFARIRAAAEKASCINNLHQVGLALTQYFTEHQYFPGPLYVGQFAGYNKNPNGALMSYLAPYCNLTPASTWQKADLFICPGWKRYAPPPSNPNYPGPTYIRNSSYTSINKSDPWGYPAQPYFPPTNISVIVNMGVEWALRDADKGEFGGTEPGWFDNLPDNPVHGDSRNYLFLDGHTDSQPITRFGTSIP
jgi:prepilin-type N-terminal cleavage/methylation domain-containing protein/prepilin-type processing-associated H-X9-DG protein